MCIAAGCSNSVSFADIEVVGEGFVCSLECEAAVLAAAREED